MRTDDVGEGGPPEARPRVVVLFWDEDRERRLALESIAGEAGADFVVFGPGSAAAPMLDVSSSSSLRFGLVSLGTERTRDAALSVIRDLTKSGVRVLAYGDRLHDWTIGLRCRALLAGAVALLDSSEPHIVHQLWARLDGIRQTEARLAREQDEVRSTFSDLGIVGQSDAMKRLFLWTVRVSRLSDLHTLITGETGTGKQLFAQAIHQLDPKRHGGPFVVVNCGAISPALAESELFGHRRGAFTGADRDRKGLIRASHGGVLLLDEIGETELGLQAKLLRVLQEGRVLGVGEDHEVAVDTRVIAATNRNLEEMVANRTFRADLFHRLTVLSVHIPPLRDRPDDLGPLVRHFVGKHAHIGAGRPPLVGSDFMAALARTELLGNAREVENVVRRAIVHNDGESALTLADLPAKMWSHVSQLASRGDEAQGLGPRPDSGVDPEIGSAYLWQMLSTNGWSLARSLASCERALVEGALRSANGNQSGAARLLGVTPRSVYNKRRKYRLQPKSA